MEKQIKFSGLAKLCLIILLSQIYYVEHCTSTLSDHLYQFEQIFDSLSKSPIFWDKIGETTGWKVILQMLIEFIISYNFFSKKKVKKLITCLIWLMFHFRYLWNWNDQGIHDFDSQYLIFVNYHDGMT